MATIATYAIATAEIERPDSPTPSEGSIYYDLDEEVEVPSNSTSSISTGITTLSEHPTPVEQSVQEQIEPPSTPQRPTLSLQTTFSVPEVSPSSGSDRSSTSIASPNTDFGSRAATRSRTSSFDFNFELKQQKPLPKRTHEEPCLQCHLAGMECSFTARYYSLHPSRPRNDGTCTRCARNGESFCIAQMRVEKDVDRTLWEKESRYSFIYYAEGVETEVVLEKAECLLEKKASKIRALPEASAWKREMLRRVFAGCWRKEDADER